MIDGHLNNKRPHFYNRSLYLQIQHSEHLFFYLCIRWFWQFKGELLSQIHLKCGNQTHLSDRICTSDFYLSSTLVYVAIFDPWQMWARYWMHVEVMRKLWIRGAGAWDGDKWRFEEVKQQIWIRTKLWQEGKGMKRLPPDGEVGSYLQHAFHKRCTKKRDRNHTGRHENMDAKTLNQ